MLGHCGRSRDHCRSPDCQIDYGRCDAHRSPKGPPTSRIPRPRVGEIDYGPFIVSTCTVPGTVALTYDDGPGEHTDALLDLLAQYDAKVTFFVSGVSNGKGQIDEDFPWIQLIQRMDRDGHQIASHTWSHQDLDKITPVQRQDQMFKNEAALRNILGGFPTYMRPPYSSCSLETGCLSEMGRLGYHVILFDLDTDDYNNDDPNLIQRSKDRFDFALDKYEASDKSWLVISHDVHDQTVHNLTEHMLRRLRNDGYRPVTVGECLGDPKVNWYRQAGGGTS